MVQRSPKRGVKMRQNRERCGRRGEEIDESEGEGTSGRYEETGMFVVVVDVAPLPSPAAAASDSVRGT